MKSVFKILAAGFLLFAANTFASTDMTDRDSKFAALMQTLDISSSEYTLEYKTHGTSVGMHVRLAVDDKKFGKWAPQNEATDVEAQVVSYRLGLYLNMSYLVTPSEYYSVKDSALETFANFVRNSSEKNSLRQKNRSRQLAVLAKNPSSISGVFTQQPSTAEVLQIADTSANTISSSNPIARFISAGGPVPSKTKKMSLAGVKTKTGEIPTETEFELARQFSQIMVLDMLCGQWDRWSGGNVEATWDKALNVRFFARDNGGAEMYGTSAIQKYLHIVSRFDRDQITRVRQLAADLSKSPSETASSLGLKSDPKSLLARAKIVLQLVAQKESEFGSAAYF